MGELKTRMLMKMELRNFSKRTIEMYLYHMKKFVAFYGKSPDTLGRSEVEEYLHSLFQREASASWIIQAYSSLKYFYYEVLDKPDIVLKLRRPKSEKKLPVVLSMNEVKKIIDNVKSYRDQTVLMAIYSAGLRLNEGVKLKIRDIDSQRMQIRVEQGKGRKDRYTLLSEVLLQRLRDYYKIYKPKEWLFPGRAKNIPVSGSSIQKSFFQAKKKPAFQKQHQYIHSGIVLQPIC
jgi:site-specific recombinase XerD